MDDLPREADAIITKGVSYGGSCAPQIKVYMCSTRHAVHLFN